MACEASSLKNRRSDLDSIFRIKKKDLSDFCNSLRLLFIVCCLFLDAVDRLNDIVGIKVQEQVISNK